MFKIGGVVIRGILGGSGGGGGGGRTGLAGSGGSSVDHRERRSWDHHDLQDLTSATRRTRIARGKVVLNLLVERRTEELFWYETLWMQVLDDLLSIARETLEEITLSDMCYDLVWGYIQQRPGRMLERCRGLRRVNLEGGWCQNVAELLQYLHSVVGVLEVLVSAVEIEGVSWFEVLQTLRRSGTTFEFFEVKASRCRSDFYPWQVDSSCAAPWSGESRDVTSWLRNESTAFPLVQGPG